MQAGRLEIEIVAEIAKLQQDMRQVEREVGKMADGVGRKTKAVNDNFALFGRGISSAGNSSKLASHHAQNLAFQFQDIGVQMAAATQSSEPFKMAMMALFQQGTQINGIMQQSGLSVGGLTKQIVRMTGTIIGKIGPAAVALAAGTYHMKQFTDALNDSAGADAFIQTLGLTADEIKELENTTVSFGDVAMGTWDVVAAGLWDVIGPAVTGAKSSFDDWFAQSNANGAKLINDLVGGFVGGFNAIGAVWSKLPAAIGDIAISTANSVISAINKMIQMAVNGINGLIGAANSILSKAGMEIGTLSAPQIGAIQNSYEGAGQGAGKAFGEAFQASQKDYWGQFTGAVGDAAVARRNARLQAQADELRGDRKGGKAGARKKALDDEAKALERAIKESTRYAEALEMETSRIGKSVIEIKKMEIAANAASAPTEELRQRIIAAGQAWEAATRAQAQADFESNVLQPLRDELALLGLVGPERELAALALEEQAFKARLAKDGIEDVNGAWEEYLKIRKQIIEGESALERETEAAKLLNDQLRDMIGLLGGLGGIGQAVGGLLGIFTGNTSAVGGPIGDLLNAQIGTMEKDGKIVARTIGDEVARVFKTDGAFGKTMTNLLQGAGTGLTAANAVFGKQSTTESIGAALGGAAGKALGAAVAGPLGAAVGSVIGGLAGSALGGLFNKGNTTARANITGADNISIAGADSKGYGAAGELAKSVVSGLQDIATALGGTLGSFNTTIGTRGDEFRVNTSGTSLKLDNGAVGFGQDAQAAVAFAIADAIKDGALQGLRAGTKALLESGDDLQAQLQKALTFEDVFKQLQAQTDPLAFALDGIATKFDYLRQVFDEAGASAAEYAQLAQLQALETAAATENAAQQAIRDFQEKADLQVRILQLQGKEQEALALARESELKGVKAALKPLQQMIYRLEDARAIMDQFKPLADSLREFRQELLGTRSGDNFAALRSQYQTTAAGAANGDAASMARLQQDATAYLDAARENATSALDYQRAVGTVLGSVDQAIFSADNQVAMAQAQLNATTETNSAVNRVRDEVAEMREKNREQNDRMEKIWKRFEGDGIPLRYDADNPLNVAVV